MLVTNCLGNYERTSPTLSLPSNSTGDYELRELHESFSKRIRVIRSRSIFVVQIIKFKVQTSNFKGTTNYANCTNHLAIRIRVIRAIRSRSIFVVLIIKFKVQTSKFKVNSSKLTVILPYKQSRSVSSFRHQM